MFSSWNKCIAQFTNNISSRCVNSILNIIFDFSYEMNVCFFFFYFNRTTDCTPTIFHVDVLNSFIHKFFFVVFCFFVSLRSFCAWLFRHWLCIFLFLFTFNVILCVLPSLTDEIEIRLGVCVYDKNVYDNNKKNMLMLTFVHQII